MNFEKFPTFIHCEEVAEVCKPLLPLGITDFIFIRIFPDGSKADLCTNRAWAKWHFDYYYQGKYEQELIRKNEIITDGIELSKFSEDVIWSNAKENFGIGNSLLIKKSHPTFSEIFIFCSDRFTDKINAFYLENLDSLLKFCFYFKEKAEKLIVSAENVLMPVANHYKNIFRDKHIIVDKKPNLDLMIDKYFIEDTYITERERVCLHWISKGKSAEETGIILGISRRTVESHINSVKSKFGIVKICELVLKVQACVGFIDLNYFI